MTSARRDAVIPVPPNKARITIRLDKHIVAWFKSQVEAAGGGSYQALIKDALREHIGHREK